MQELSNEMMIKIINEVLEGLNRSALGPKYELIVQQMSNKVHVGIKSGETFLFPCSVERSPGNSDTNLEEMTHHCLWSVLYNAIAYGTSNLYLNSKKLKI